MKIYNEIVIDMNPQSPSFEKVLYEDSFEYSEDDMIWAQDTTSTSYQDTADQYNEWKYQNVGDKVVYGDKYYLWSDKWNQYQEQIGKFYDDAIEDTSYVAYEDAHRDFIDAGGVYDPDLDRPATLQDQPHYQGTDWGAPSISKDMFISTGEGGQYPSVSPAGQPRTKEEIYKTLDPILTGIKGPELLNYINDMLPQFTGVSAEAIEFKVKEKEYALEAAKTGYEKDIYALQPDIGGAVTPTTGVDMRSKISGEQDIKRQFTAAGEAYDLSKRRADTGYEASIYGLETAAGKAYETSVLASIGQMETPFADPGGTTQTQPWGSWRKGGRVPSKEETFLDVLIQLPDAGGS